ncbi:hypothetical protein [Arthrobacter silviterrae]|nr:hypothetical protein [Arthrobacter silviterrae]
MYWLAIFPFDGRIFSSMSKRITTAVAEIEGGQRDP